MYVYDLISALRYAYLLQRKIEYDVKLLCNFNCIQSFEIYISIPRQLFLRVYAEMIHICNE